MSDDLIYLTATQALAVIWRNHERHLWQSRSPAASKVSSFFANAKRIVFFPSPVVP